jgi:prolyl oligopeptidase
MGSTARTAGLTLAALGLGAALAAEVAEDPYRWLEEVEGDKALAWVKERSDRSAAKIQAMPGFEQNRSRIEAILNDTNKIPYVGKIGSHYYNFWQDQQHEKGLWRRTSLEEYRKASPQWETVLDLDALSAAEKESWVWHGAQCLPPEYRRCLVALSRGGKDADVVREFDLVDKAFVRDGFSLPEAKGGASWIDLDTLMVGTDFGPGSLTTSGYPRQAKRWRRSTPLAEAPLVYQGEESDVSAGAYRDLTPGFEREFAWRAMTFYSTQNFQIKDGQKVRIDVPEDANMRVHRQWLLVELRSDWEVGGKKHLQGSLLIADFDRYMAGERQLEALFVPTERSALSSWTATKNTIVLNVLDNVRSKVLVARPEGAGWKLEPMAGLTDFGSIYTDPVDSYESDDLWLTVTDFLTPTTHSLQSGGKVEQLKAMPAFFNAAGLEISQHQAKSKDGTAIPYFQVSRKGLKLKGKNSTLLYGYGGFEVSMLPTYSGGIGSAWLEKGGVYVLANIRGGGEFGPRWHQAALKQHRHKAYEDFAAVAEDLHHRKVTRPEKLGIMGGSNGGLLMGNMLTQYPQLFGAVVCQVPLLDMRNYHKMLAGASWMGEYGDPDDPEQWSFIQTFSPYHLLRKEQKYPAVLFTTSTRDDRVHPGHARKMVARMEEQGHPVLYWENMEGGHGGAANNAQRAYMNALSYTFLWDALN